MATCPVRIEFYCENALEDLKYIHNVPRSLTIPADAGYTKRFTSVIGAIMKEHEDVCRAASSLFCGVCRSNSTGVLQTPMSWLQQVEDPFVGVWVNSVCGNDRCERQTRQEVQETMDELLGEYLSEVELGSVEVLCCRVCGKTEEIMRCGRCRVVGYCGKEHQREDWKGHKRNCVSNDG